MSIFYHFADLLTMKDLLFLTTPLQSQEAWCLQFSPNVDDLQMTGMCVCERLVVWASVSADGLLGNWLSLIFNYNQTILWIFPQLLQRPTRTVVNPGDIWFFIFLDQWKINIFLPGKNNNLKFITKSEVWIWFLSLHSPYKLSRCALLSKCHQI